VAELWCATGEVGVKWPVWIELLAVAMRVRVKDLRVGVRLGMVMGAVLVLLCVVSG
jgi:hypothetical protein